MSPIDAYWVAAWPVLLLGTSVNRIHAIASSDLDCVAGVAAGRSDSEVRLLKRL